MSNTIWHAGISMNSRKGRLYTGPNLVDSPLGIADRA